MFIELQVNTITSKMLNISRLATNKSEGPGALNFLFVFWNYKKHFNHTYLFISYLSLTEQHFYRQFLRGTLCRIKLKFKRHARSTSQRAYPPPHRFKIFLIRTLHTLKMKCHVAARSEILRVRRMACGFYL